MKAFCAVVLLCGLIQGTPALAAPPAASPLLGTWAVDTTRLPMAAAARPKSVTFTFADVGGNKLKTEVDIVDAGDVRIHSTSTVGIDGVPGSITGGMEADTVALKQPAPNVLVMVLSKARRPGSTRIYVASPDGKSMVETATYFGDNGTPIIRTNYFTRVR
ncbi:hypothetical protein KK141_02790 [Dyella sp. LX-66]|uniref:hypothetical protein n=1 Tax=unclassified Dyella TaxID=2634549 RepID=UPI001BDFEF71|nr:MULTISPECIES: hypothetical protein [unclassified Dyella]MBT2117396.1 hypothetical protein [Dyella sp. LX-1]MBT2138460.1 hypothetical protein [Dyella sp. LX-66]